MSAFSEVRPGLRFALAGCEFEVAYAESGMVRYNAVAGGKAYRVTINRFLELVNFSSEKISAESAPPSAIPALVGLNEQQTRASLRRIRYVQTVMAALDAPKSLQKLQKLIPVIAVELADFNPPNPRTVAGWVRRYQLAGKDISGCRSQTERRGNRTLWSAPAMVDTQLRALGNARFSAEAVIEPNELERQVTPRRGHSHITLTSPRIVPSRYDCIV